MKANHKYKVTVPVLLCIIQNGVILIWLKQGFHIALICALSIFITDLHERAIMQSRIILDVNIEIFVMQLFFY